MCHKRSSGWSVVASLVVAAGLSAWPAAAGAQTVVGNAEAAKVSTFSLLGGTTTVLASTGDLSGVGDAQGAGQTAGGVSSVLSSESLQAATMAWSDQVVSQASLGSVGITVAGIPISADFVMASVTSLLESGSESSFLVENLFVAGTPVTVTGEPNQTIGIPGGRVVLNEQTISSNGVTTVNALHVVVFGVADVVVASATAGIH